MNTLINQLFTSFATSDLKSYLGRASDETLDMAGGLVQSLITNEPATSTVCKTPTVDLYAKLHDDRFFKVVVHLTRVTCMMVSVDCAITAEEIENKLRSFIDAMRENSAECATWSKVRDALNAAGNGNYADLELALTASESTRQTVLDILESYRATVQLGDRFLQAMPGNVAILLSNLTLEQLIAK